jgi:hypothetical protein
MLGEYALKYYNEGYSCSQCIIMAACRQYGIRVNSDNICSATKGINNGFGVGAMCSVPITCVMVIGLYFNNEAVIKQKRLEFMLRFKEKFKSFNCSELQKRVYRCDEVIKSGCDILSELLD